MGGRPDGRQARRQRARDRLRARLRENTPYDQLTERILLATSADGRPVGYVTSAGYGYSIDAPIAYAWLPSDAAQAGQPVTIRYFGEAVQATVATDPLFDPQMTRLRS